MLDNITSNLENLESLLKEYAYNSEIININVEEVLNKYRIGKWLLDNKNKFFIFASEKYSRKYHKNPILIYLQCLIMLRLNMNYPVFN